MSYLTYKQNVRTTWATNVTFLYMYVCVSAHMCGYTHICMRVLSLKSNSRVSPSVTLSTLRVLTVSGTD